MWNRPSEALCFLSPGFHYFLMFLQPQVKISGHLKREGDCGEGSVGKGSAPSNRRASVQISRTQKHTGHVAAWFCNPSLGSLKPLANQPRDLVSNSKGREPLKDSQPQAFSHTCAAHKQPHMHSPTQTHSFKTKEEHPGSLCVSIETNLQTGRMRNA